MVTETVQLDPARNPAWNAEMVETELKAFLGVGKVVWLPRGLTKDYDRFGTRGHIDIIATFARIFAANALEEHLDGHFVRDEVSLVHERFRQHAKLRLVAHVLAEHVPGGDMQQLRGVGNALRLRALAGAWRSEKNDKH